MAKGKGKKGGGKKGGKKGQALPDTMATGGNLQPRSSLPQWKNAPKPVPYTEKELAAHQRDWAPRMAMVSPHRPAPALVPSPHRSPPGMPPPSPTSPGSVGFSVPGTPVSPAFSAATVVGVRLPLPIVRAALQGDHETILSWLANSMNDIDATWSSPDRHYRGYTLLMLATQAMDEPLVDALIRRECSLDHQDANKGLTALMMAVQRGRPTLVSRLLAAGARTDLRLKLAYALPGQVVGPTAAEIAIDKKQPVLAEIIRTHEAKVEAQRKALANGEGMDAATMEVYQKKLDAASDELYLPNDVVEAAASGDVEAIISWLDAGGKLEAKTAPPPPPAMPRAQSDPSVAALANIAAQEAAAAPEGDGQLTLLMIAVLNGREELVTALLDRGARTDVKRTTDGATLILMAAYNQHRGVVRLLLQNQTGRRPPPPPPGAPSAATPPPGGIREVFMDFRLRQEPVSPWRKPPPAPPLTRAGLAGKSLRSPRSLLSPRSAWAEATPSPGYARDTVASRGV